MNARWSPPTSNRPEAGDQGRGKGENERMSIHEDRGEVMRPDVSAGLYIHIPFCLGKCHYCHFYSTNAPDLVPAYLTALEREMTAWSSFPGDFARTLEGKGPEVPCRTGAAATFDTVYFGGGTPSLLSVPQFSSLLESVTRHFRLSCDPEITVEVNPADQDSAWFKAMKQLGINRLQTGIQSFDDSILRFLGRRHTAADARAAIEMAANAGFTNVGLDLIYGIPGQELGAWTETLGQAVALGVAHLSCYELSVEEGTPFAERFRRGDFALSSEERQRTFFETTAAYLEGTGYHHYEISNYARGPSFISRHNRKYWNHMPYLGLGPSAHSFAAGSRWWNRDSLDAYLQDIQSGRIPVQARERLTDDQMRLETLFLGLRTIEGIDLGDFQTAYGYDLRSRQRMVLDKLLDEGLLVVKNDHLRATRNGFAVADRLALILSD